MILDLEDMPDFNPSVGTHGLTSVSDGHVRLGLDGKPYCYRHGAMNAVNPDRTIWRCLQLCGHGCYMERG